jgi:RNAse (barnase) inhibitor barstar
LEIKLAELLKSSKIPMELKAGNIEELGVSLSKYITSLIEILNKSNEQLEGILNLLYEENLRCYGLQISTFNLIAEKLKDVYGVEIDISQLQKDARNKLDENWPELKKEILDHIDVARKIDEIFKKE